MSWIGCSGNEIVVYYEKEWNLIKSEWMNFR